MVHRPSIKPHPVDPNRSVPTPTTPVAIGGGAGSAVSDAGPAPIVHFGRGRGYWCKPKGLVIGERVLVRRDGRMRGAGNEAYIDNIPFGGAWAIRMIPSGAVFTVSPRQIVAVWRTSGTPVRIK